LCLTQRTRSGWTTLTVQLGPQIYHFGKITTVDLKVLNTGQFRARWRLGRTLIADHRGASIHDSPITNRDTLITQQKLTWNNVNTTTKISGNGARTTALMRKISELAVTQGHQRQLLESDMRRRTPNSHIDMMGSTGLGAHTPESV